VAGGRRHHRADRDQLRRGSASSDRNTGSRSRPLTSSRTQASSRSGIAIGWNAEKRHLRRADRVNDVFRGQKVFSPDIRAARGCFSWHLIPQA